MHQDEPTKQQDRSTRQQNHYTPTQQPETAMQLARMHHHRSSRSDEPPTLPPITSFDRDAPAQPRSLSNRRPSVLDLSSSRGPLTLQPSYVPPPAWGHVRADSESLINRSQYVAAPARSASVAESSRQPVSSAFSQHSYEEEQQQRSLRRSEPYSNEQAFYPVRATVYQVPPPSLVRPLTGSSTQLDSSDYPFRYRQPNARSAHQPLERDTEQKLIHFHSLCTDATVFVGSLLDARHEPQPEQLRDMITRVNAAGELLSSLTSLPAVPVPWSTTHQASPSLEQAHAFAARHQRIELNPSRPKSARGTTQSLDYSPSRYGYSAFTYPEQRAWNDEQEVVREQGWKRQGPRSEGGEECRSARPEGERTAQEQNSPRSPTSYPTSSTDGDANSATANKYRKRSRAPAPASCDSCGISDTPEWRRGPGGARTLCNACGLHYSKLAKRRKADKTGTVSIQELRSSIGLQSEAGASGVVGHGAHASSTSPVVPRLNAKTPAAAYASARAGSEAYYAEASQPASKRRAVSQGSVVDEET